MWKMHTRNLHKRASTRSSATSSLTLGLHHNFLTRTRAGQLGYWDSVKGGALDVDEMCKLMGFKKRALNVTGVKDSAFAGCLGNGCSVTFLTFLIPEVLFAIGLISKTDLNLLRQRAEVHRLMLGMRP